MMISLRTRLRRHPARAAAIAVCASVAVVFAAWQGTVLVGWAGFSAQLNAAVEADPGPIIREATWSFQFLETECTVTVPVYAEEFRAAQGLDTSQVFSSQEWVRARYVSTLVNTEARSATVRAITRETRLIRANLNLDQDEYVELLTSFVQSIPYGEISSDVMVPAQVIASGSGVCTEKSVLLGALLRREGYDTVVWIFDSQNHVGLGVASDAMGFRGTRYAFIETTEKRYIGEAAKICWSSGPNARRPQMVSLGGSRQYRAGAQVAYILQQLDGARSLEHALAPYARYASSAIRWREHYAQLAGDRDRATRRVAYLEANSHNRPGVFTHLTRSGDALARVGADAVQAQ